MDPYKVLGVSPNASDADFGLAMSGIKPSEHTEKGDGAK